MQRIILIISVFFLLGSINTNIFAEGPVKFLSSIRVTSDFSKETIHLNFKSELKEIPSLHFDNGLIKIAFPNTEFEPKLSRQVINDRFVQMIFVEKEGTSTVLEVRFSDTNFEAVGLVDFRATHNNLDVIINKTDKASPNPEENEVSLTERITSEESPDYLPIAGSFLAGNDDMTVNIVKMLLALFVLLIFFYILLWAYNRFFVSKFSFKKGKHAIKVTSAYHISPKQKVVILEINDMAFACGVSSSSINVISKVSDDSFAKYLSSQDFDKNKDLDFFEIRAQYIESKRQQKQHRVKKTESTFASEFINRVKKLKPLD